MRKILVLEDQAVEQKAILSVIDTIESQTEVVVCADTKEAYVHALEGNIDLFIVDVILKPEYQEDTSGLRFIKAIRGVTRYEFTPVIILTCLEDLKSYSYSNLHCYAYIEKPFLAEHLRKTIGECLRSPRQKKKEQTLYYRKDGAILAIQSGDVTYVDCIRHSLHIHTRQKDEIVIPYLTLKQFLVDVDDSDFIQCSRNAAVNKKYAVSLDLAGKRICLQGGADAVEIGGKFAGMVKESFGGGEDA